MFLLRFYLIGMDLLKHGESAYPADAWVEQQYMKEDAIDVSYFPRFFDIKLAILSSSVSFYDYLKWILKMTFERHQINLFLTFPLFFAERGEMAFYSLLDLEVEMRSYQNHQTISNINEWDEMTFYAFKYIQICKSSHIMCFFLIPFSNFRSLNIKYFLPT